MCWSKKIDSLHKKIKKKKGGKKGGISVSDWKRDTWYSDIILKLAVLIRIYVWTVWCANQLPPPSPPAPDRPASPFLPVSSSLLPCALLSSPLLSTSYFKNKKNISGPFLYKIVIQNGPFRGMISLMNKGPRCKIYRSEKSKKCGGSSQEHQPYFHSLPRHWGITETSQV